MLVFGLTGGIASGKSTVRHLLTERHGIPVVDADHVARQVLAKGSEGLAAVVEAFGPELLLPDGSLDRSALRARIFADPDARATLNGLTHPRIVADLTQQLATLAAEGCPLAGVEAALLVETGGYTRYPELVVVRTSPGTQLERLMARDGATAEAARTALAAQAPVDAKVAVATYVLDNDGSEAELPAKVDALAAWLRARAAEAQAGTPDQ